MIYEKSAGQKMEEVWHGAASGKCHPTGEMQYTLCHKAREMDIPTPELDSHWKTPRLSATCESSGSSSPRGSGCFTKGR